MTYVSSIQRSTLNGISIGGSLLEVHFASRLSNHFRIRLALKRIHKCLRSPLSREPNSLRTEIIFSGVSKNVPL